jgi:uracil-DNA glycosylase
MMAGEQPGNDEAPQGHRALEEAGIQRSEVYVTNAVKHFKFEELRNVASLLASNGRSNFLRRQ